MSRPSDDGQGSDQIAGSGVYVLPFVIAPINNQPTEYVNLNRFYQKVVGWSRQTHHTFTAAVKSSVKTILLATMRLETTNEAPRLPPEMRELVLAFAIPSRPLLRYH